MIAHRGAFKKNGFPENSIASLREAIRLGCAGSEFDVRMTLDSVLVINHDPHYHEREIEKTTYAELTRYRLSNGEPLPTLAAYLAAGRQENPATRLVMEIKPSEIKTRDRWLLIAEAALKEVRAAGVQAYTEYISFDWNQLLVIKQLDKRAMVHYLNGDLSPEKVKAAGVNGIDYNITVFQKNPGWVKEALHKKLIINAWTVNKDEQLDWCLQQGFTYITTNEPERLFQKLR